MAFHRNGSVPERNGAGVGSIRRAARLLYPGIGLKRWAILTIFGISTGLIGFAYLIRKVYYTPFPDFLPWYLEGFLLLIVGICLVLISLYGIYRTLRPFLMNMDPIDNIADSMYSSWSRNRAPKIATIGGGTGMSVLLRGLSKHTDNLTAIITVADDGGSSGRLRRELGVLPPGDFRKCLIAMSDDKSMLSDLLDYRFERGSGLEGHSFGNLFIIAMNSIMNDFDQALIESSRILAVRGKVVPVTSNSLYIKAIMEDGRTIHGESNITQELGQIEELAIDPADIEAHPDAVEAIKDADLVVIGPGSLYTSILPNLLIGGISDALRTTSAAVVFVCNVATERGETDGYTVARHLATLQDHTFLDIADFVLANNRMTDMGERFEGTPVTHDGSVLEHSKIVMANLLDDNHPVRHDSDKLAAEVMNLSNLKKGIRPNTRQYHSSVST